MSERTQSKPPKRQKKQSGPKKPKPSKHLEHEIISEINPNSHGYRDAAEIISTKLHALFVNTLQVSAPPLIYDIETLMVYMMDSAPTHLAELMTNEFNQGYMAGFVLAAIDYQQAEIEATQEEEQYDQE